VNYLVLPFAHTASTLLGDAPCALALMGGRERGDASTPAPLWHPRWFCPSRVSLLMSLASANYGQDFSPFTEISIASGLELDDNFANTVRRKHKSWLPTSGCYWQPSQITAQNK